MYKVLNENMAIKKYPKISLSIATADEEDFELFCEIAKGEKLFYKKRKINPRLDDDASNMELYYPGISHAMTFLWKRFLEVYSKKKGIQHPRPEKSDSEKSEGAEQQ